MSALGCTCVNRGVCAACVEGVAEARRHGIDPDDVADRFVARVTSGERARPLVSAAAFAAVDANRDAQRTRAEAAEAEVARLRAALAAVLPFQNCNGHAHARDGIWDPDNSGGRACRPCVKCHAFADARDAIGRPRWPSPQSVDGHEAGDHAEGCGCGGARR